MDDTTDTKPENKWGTKNKKPHASQSFTEEQVHTLGVLFDTVLRGGDTTVLRKHKSFTDRYRKVTVMQKRIAHMKAGNHEL